MLAGGPRCDKRPRVYLARGPEGLETGSRGSINTEIIERVGAVNVVEGLREKGGLVTASPEQVIAWAPDTIITLDRNFLAEPWGGKPEWQVRCWLVSPPAASFWRRACRSASSTRRHR